MSTFMTDLLSKYLQIVTAHPNPDYESARELFKKQAALDSFLTREITLASGHVVLVITYPGTDNTLPAVALNHHMDVVPALNTDEWEYPPFAGVITDKFIIGRGAQDMKGVGVAHYAALRQLKTDIPATKRTVHLLLVPDEEIGGHKGTQELVNHLEFRALNIGYVVDEGLPSGNPQELLIKTEERTPIQIRVVSTGKMGHASQLFHENTVCTLLKFLSDVTCFHEEQKRLALTDCNQPGQFVSVQITSLKTNTNFLNVIPSQAEATVDIRMPARYTHTGILCWLDALAIKHDVTYEVLATSYDRFEPVTTSSTLYQIFSKVITAEGLTPRSCAFEATTDLRFYSGKDIEGIGITPFTVQPNLHGTNEHISIKDLELGQRIFFNFLQDFCL